VPSQHGTVVFSGCQCMRPSVYVRNHLLKEFVNTILMFVRISL